MEQPADFDLLRAGLRREKLALRMALPNAAYGALCTRLASHLAAALALRPATSIGFCAPVRNEFDARPLVARLVAAGWQACMPTVVEAAAPLRFRPWTPGSAMCAERHGIPVPDTAETVAAPAILLLPLVAFDDAGFRLGYGGGYFDRTLAASVPRPLAIGVGFELGRTATIHPQAHDQRCDAIVTEAGWQSHSPAWSLYGALPDAS